MADEIENDEGFDTPVERTTNALDNLSIQEERVIEVRRRRRRRRTTRLRTPLLTWRFLLLRLGRGPAQSKLTGTVGFDTLPMQITSHALKRPIEFNVMLVGTPSARPLPC